MQFKVTILSTGKNTAGIKIDPAVPEALGGGKTPLVSVTLNGFTYASKIASMRGDLWIPVSAEIREKAKVEAGGTYDIAIVLDSAPRVIEPTADLAAPLAADPVAQAAWDKLAPSRKKAYVTTIEGTKSRETRARRVERTLAELRGED
jgi:hypothetical protein